MAETTMKILWFPRLQADVDRLHIVTWRAVSQVLLDRGHDLRLVVTGKPDGFPPGVLVSLPVWNFKGGRLLVLWLLGPLLAWHLGRRFHPDVVILDPFTSWFARLWPRRSGNRPVLISDHRTPSDHFFLDRTPLRGSRLRKHIDRLDWKRLGSHLDGATVISDHYRGLILNRYHVDPQRIAVWGSGVDPLFLTPIPPKPSSSDPAQPLVLMQHGEWSFNRGLLETVTAVDLCRSIDLHLILLGQGPAATALEQAIRSSGTPQRFTLQPSVPHGQVIPWIDGADIAVMAYPAGEYWNCNCPIKLVEYLARGKVVIATDMPGFREVTGDLPGIYWLKTPIPDPQEIAEAIRTIAREPLEWRRAALDGQERMSKEFTWSRQTERLLAFLGRRRADKQDKR
jgi:glycosyltransferase involved in cell wall biosynthesis